ncbi:MAG: hypothetical protein RR448_09495 [Niameybacter sp.]|uniref:hypothetical protein n=1 Tax=Niameybacter sp. TaxID=2033640 RepID=UPI002FC73442
MRTIPNTETLSKAQKTKVSTLVAVSSYILYMIKNLEEYSDATDALLQFELLSIHFQVDALLNQIFGYVD